MTFGRNKRPDGKKARKETPKADDWLLHLPRGGQMVMVASLYISKIRLFISTHFSMAIDFRKEISW